MNLNDDILATLEGEEREKNDALCFEFSEALYSSPTENEVPISTDIFKEAEENLALKSEKEEKIEVKRF